MKCFIQTQFRCPSALRSDDPHLTNAMQEQAAVLRHLHGTLLVMAPAGTGKTRLMTEVIKRLPHNATVEQAAEMTPVRFAAARRAETQAIA